MKKLDKRFSLRLGALALSAVLLGTVAALAAGGDRDDPLVTLSYLNQTAIPQIVKQVEASAALKQAELTKTFTAQINQYLQQGGQTGSVSGGSSSASYTLVSMAGGQRMSLGVGCEMLLRVGSVTVTADSAPALIDMTTGGSVNTGASLTRNHLYLCTIPDRSLTASGDVKLLVRGSYTVT